jgi:type IV pilus assembly protein PilN
MILRVNLLPYREARRLRRVQEIMVAWVATAIVGLILVFSANNWIEGHITGQGQVRDKNKKVIAKLDKKLGEIKDINSRKKQVKARLGIIETLSQQRDLPVHLLEDISRAIPKNVWLKEISTSEMSLTIVGITLSNAMVADFMRQLEKSPTMTSINLNTISQVNSTKTGDNKKREFKLNATIVLQAIEKSKATPPAKGGK